MKKGMKKALRQKLVRDRKNFFPTLAATALLWILIFALVYFVEPATPYIMPVFFVLTFLAFLFTFSTALANSRRGLILSSAVTLFLFLRYLGVGNIINLLLIFGIAVTVEVYYSKHGA
jgi:hypothetical protein